MLYDELEDYLKENLKIYLAKNNKISYLALTDIANIFAAK